MMKLVVLLCALAYAYAGYYNTSTYEITPSHNCLLINFADIDIEAHFNDYISKFNKKYTAEEYPTRFANFQVPPHTKFEFNLNINNCKGINETHCLC